MQRVEVMKNKKPAQGWLLSSIIGNYAETLLIALMQRVHILTRLVWVPTVTFMF
jgi:hypothetical protein